MRRWLATVAVVGLAAAALAGTPAEERPVFVGWMDPAKPLDRAILVYWQRVEAGEASAAEMVDLGTMLFERGFPKDAIRMLRRAAKAAEDGHLAAEAWFRSGLVHHKLGRLRQARRDYRKAIRRFPGHGWCNFYLALAAERLGRVGEALHHYERAYRFAPALADPKVNPDVLYSKLQAGVVVEHERRRSFATRMPLEPLEPQRVAAAREGRPLEPEPAAAAPTPPAAPRPAPPGSGAVAPPQRKPGKGKPVGIHPGRPALRSTPAPTPGGGG